MRHNPQAGWKSWPSAYTPYSIDVMCDLTLKEHVIGSSIGYCNDHPKVIKLVQDGKINLVLRR
ncbi:hypothetical protein [Corynebacterium sp. NML120713]|uniref:hypothetical protein n=1 Tax=Corynebacterium sp. NML120713 TaxID=1906332 RepID=UPI00091104EA|nr:hypothetical protein [Corynebacterium sp. NML120713]OIR44515.1 hypothetical protein BJP06_02545 [Corynebacterium sp. NML120713]